MPTRDAVLPIVAVLAASKGTSVAALRDGLPGRVTWSDRIKDFPTADGEAVLAWLRAGGAERMNARFGRLAGDVATTDETDGLRMTFADGGIVHLRPSGNAPELRCYTEADDPDRARALNAATLALVRDELAEAARRG